MSTLTLLAELSQRLDERRYVLDRLDTYAAGRQAPAFLAPEAKAALGNRLQVLNVNVCRLAVTSLAERLRVEGFRIGDDAIADVAVWQVWEANGMTEESGVAHEEALTLGAAYVLVWAGPDRATPRVSVESAKQVAVARDPATRQVTAALKRWTEVVGQHSRGRALVLEADKVTRLATKASVVEGAAIPATGWTVLEELPNRTGRVPLVPLVNRGRLLDLDGVSEIADLTDLADALAKLHADMMVTSEFFSRPRRWATGIEVPVDEAGEPVNPFASEADRTWISEDPSSKFGQFAPADLAGYDAAIATLTREIAAVSSLPGHLLGLHADQPASADAIRSAESGLVTRALARQRTFATAWAEVVRLIVAVRDGTDTTRLPVEVLWADPETRTPAQAADRAAKLVGAGVLPVDAALADLGYTPEQIDRVRQMRRQGALDSQGVDLAGLIGGGDATA